MEEKMIYVPYDDFVDGVMAKAELDSIRGIIVGGGGYCSQDIRTILGLPKEEEK